MTSTSSISSAARRAAVAAYKERKPQVGVFAVRCAATGEAWVGDSRHLDTQQNGLWFTLRHGRFPNRDLQSAWTRHGETAFTFEALEALQDLPSPSVLVSTLRDLAAGWRSKLDAKPI